MTGAPLMVSLSVSCFLPAESEHLGAMAGHTTLWQAVVSEGERRLTTEREALAQVCKEAVTAVTETQGARIGNKKGALPSKGNRQR